MIVAITLPGISLYVCLPPCLRCSNSCVCFSLLPPPFPGLPLRAQTCCTQSPSVLGGGGRAKVNPMWGQGLAATTITTWLWGAGGPQGGGTGLEPPLLPLDGVQMPRLWCPGEGG